MPLATPSPLSRASPPAGSTRMACGLHLELFSTAQALPDADWGSVVPPPHVFLQPSYLRALEQSRPERMTFLYALVREEGRPVAVASFQCVDFGMDGFGPNLLPEGAAAEEAGASFFIRAQLRRVLKRMRVRILICGNLFVCGPHGFAWRPELSEERAWSALAEAVGVIQAREPSLTMVLVKDLAPGEQGATRVLRRAGFDPVQVEPTMVLTVSPSWRSFEDYLADLTTKYRHQARRARRQGEGVERRALSAGQIAELAPRVEALYGAVFERSRLRPSRVGASYFVQLKEALGDDFDFIGYFSDGGLVAFNTRLRAGDELESYYVGLDYAHNERLALYFNALLDDVEHGILTGAHHILLGRTSLERKSALGAEPVDLRIFTLHREPVLYPLARRLSSLVQRRWTARHPFRERP
ncbi:GNAT family N-acetyltransferase [Hyalangium sp.]|uniref:GNAT family N-acetyltransferase n=1 Tax=Hyalangium sp. TaxID=2028555 RepID=UPI002D433141|nr:GNAT family N-acetyltransferase [Hyalangium sp.]HYH97995.1 GNAT family N-acetyltransferase [Hyalangium sp.]